MARSRKRKAKPRVDVVQLQLDVRDVYCRHGLIDEEGNHPEEWEVWHSGVIAACNLLGLYAAQYPDAKRKEFLDLAREDIEEHANLMNASQLKQEGMLN